MIHPDRCELEDWVLEGAVGRRDLARHVESCLECAREVAWLRAERRLFTERSVEASALPPFSAIELRMRTVEAAAANDDFDLRPAPREPHRFGWARVAGVLSAAAAAVALLAGGDPRGPDPHAVAVSASASSPDPALARPTAAPWDEPPQSCDDPAFMPVAFNQECVVVEEPPPPPPPEPKATCSGDYSSLACLP